MQAVIKYPAFGQEAYWKRAEDQTRFCYITVQTPDGLSYRVKVTEGTPQWTAKAGDAIDIEIKDPPADGKSGFAYLAGQAPPMRKPGQTQGGGYNRPPAKTYTNEEVKKTADAAVAMFARVFVELTKELTKRSAEGITPEDVRNMTNTLGIELMKRLP
jgi:hypothetical protein